jgi:hypothetical protein
MKKTALFLILLFTSVCFAGELTRQEIVELGKSGKLCEIYGHQWETVIPEFYPAIYGYEPPVMRRCKICGKTQEQKKEWVTVEPYVAPLWEEEFSVPFEYEEGTDITDMTLDETSIENSEILWKEDQP